MSAPVPAAPRGLPLGGRVFHGWTMVAGLGVSVTASYGILMYAFPVFLAPMEAELGWSRTQLTGAFSLAALVAGLAAIPVGRHVDRHGARGLMTAGSVLAVLLLVAWSGVESLGAFYLLWAGIGLASAAVLYEPAFAVVANWFVSRRARALTVLTFMGGFASVVFVPLVTVLVEGLGWRAALLWCAGVLAALTVPVHALLLRRRPEDHGLLPDGGAILAPARVPAAGAGAERSVPAGEAVRGGAFRWLGAAFALSALATGAVAVHLIPLLLERGYTPGFAGAALGALGLMALPGRLILTPLGSRWPRPLVTSGIFVLQAIAVAVLLAGSGAAAVWTFVVLFGAGFGAITPARAALLAEFYGRDAYASIGGAMALLLAVPRAAAPVGASLLYVAGGYTVVLGALAAVSVASAACVLRAGGAAPAPLPSPLPEPAR